MPLTDHGSCLCAELSSTVSQRSGWEHVLAWLALDGGGLFRSVPPQQEPGAVDVEKVGRGSPLGLRTPGDPARTWE